MGSLGEAVLDLTADASKINSGIDAAKTSVTGALTGLKGQFGTASGTMMGVMSAQGIQNLGRGIISLGKDVLGAAMEGQNAQSQLNAVLESTGGIAGVTAEQVNALATSLSQVTMFDDEAILGGESLLLTFTNIGEEVFPAATETILDMSQALGQSLQTSATQLGKALQDPIQGVGALRKVGVAFTEDQEAMIKSLVESGDVMSAQKIILAELQTEFGGSAKAAGETFAGQMKILDTEFGNVKESLGTAFMPLLQQLVGLLKDGVPYIQKAVDWFSNLPDPVKGGVAALLGLIAVLVPLFTIISTVITVASALAPVFAAIGGVLMGPVGIILLIIAALALLYVAWKNNWGGIRDFGMGIWEGIKATFAEFTAFLKNIWESNFGGIRSYFETIWTVITAIWNAVKAAFQGDWTKFGEYLRVAWDAIWKYISGRFQAAWTNIKTIFINIVDGIKALFNIDWGELGRKIIDGIVNGLKNGIKAVIEAAQAVAQAALDAAKGFLGIESPSKAFMELGAFSGQGFSQGLAASLKPDAMVKTFSGVLNSVGKGVSNQRTSSTSVIVNNPRPESASSSVDLALRKLSYLGVSE